MPKIEVVGLGPGPANALTLAARDLLLSDLPVFLRTGIHPTVAELKNWGCEYTSFDHLYEQAQAFEKLYAEIASHLINEAQAHERIVYAVPGHPLVAESTVTTLIEAAKEAQVELQIHTAVSCLDVLFEALSLDPTDGLNIVDGLRLDIETLNLDHPSLITQIYSRAIAAEVKLSLLERLEPEQPIIVVRAAGCDEQELIHLPLEELDRQDSIDHLTTLYLPASDSAQHAPLQHLRQVVAKLRDPDGGCPWDLKQTPMSLRRFVLEEAYEVVSAIEADDMDALCEELGDLLLQVYLQAQIGEDEDLFDLNEVAAGIAQKLIFRHPHVFGDTEVANEDEVKRNWEELKAQEKQAKGSESVLDDLPIAMPALSLAEKIGKKVARVGFEWPDVEGVIAKIDEEYAELKEACQSQNDKEVFHELGDALFTLVNLARWYKLDPEDALRKSNQRFIERFQHMERALGGRSLRELDLESWEELWNQAKQATA